MLYHKAKQLPASRLTLNTNPTISTRFSPFIIGKWLVVACETSLKCRIFSKVAQTVCVNAVGTLLVKLRLAAVP